MPRPAFRSSFARWVSDRGPVRHLLAWVAMLVVALLLASPARAVDTQAPLDPDDVMLFDIRAEGLRLGDGVHGYRLGEAVCVDLAEFSAAIDLAIAIDKAKGVAQGWAFSERNLLTIDRPRQRVVVDGRQSAIANGTIRDASKGWCVETRALEQWLGIGIAPDLLDSTLTVSSRTPLPAVAAAARAARAETRSQTSEIARARVAGPPVETVRLPYKAWRAPSLDISANLTRADARFGMDYEAFAAGEVAWLSADGRFASDERGAPQSLRIRLYRDDPDARLIGPLRATSAAIGDVTSLGTNLGARGVTGRGAMITNRPIGQSSQFDRTDLVGDAPAGWDVELYRNGELTGLVKVGSDGRFAFREVPLLYGSNRLEIVRYGPQGQVRRERRFYEVGQSAVPPGKGWWWAHAVEENSDLIGFTTTRAPDSGWRFGAGVDYGLGLRTSASLAAHSVSRDGRRLRIVETELRRGFGPFALAIGGAADTRGGRAFTGTALGRIGQTAVSARVLANRCLLSEVIDADLHNRAELGLDRTVSIARLMIPLHFDLARTVSRFGRRQMDMGGRLSMSTRRLSASLGASLQRVAEAGKPYGPVEGTATLLLSARVRGIAMRGEVNYAFGRNGGLSDARIAAEGSFRSDDAWQASLGYSWAQDDVTIAAAYSRHFKAFTLVGSMNGGTRSGMGGRVGLLFSIGPDGRGGFGRMTSARIAATGSVAVRVLRVGGASGETDDQAATEPLPGGVRLKIGDQPAKPDPSGWIPGAPIVLSALVPAAPVFIGVDPASLDDPLLEPAVRAVRVVPRKGLVLPLVLKVAATGLVEGRLARADGSEAAGESLSLLDRDGRPVASVVTEFDGSFLFEKVRYGRYRLALDTASGLVALDPEGPPIVVSGKAPDQRLRTVTVPAAKTLVAAAD